ncbi:UNVERIFIED_CONTAM: hypothetical protein Sradi_5706500 [Sesamum radiatum]|uniref:Reverse transcriptase n=1 Tax=Sesamum radiatum TaxID=300843 RepID=A0AAW2L3U9_SESRA
MEASDPNLAVWEKIKNCRIELLKWERTDFGNMKRRIKETEERIVGKQQGKFDEATNNEVQILRRQLEEFRSNENMMWQQRSKAQWLCDRDRNTKFFHATATSRKKQNEIRRIKDMNGNWREDPSGEQEVLLGYFPNIFARSTTSDRIHEEVLNTVRPKVTAEMNEALIQPFTEHEVRSALFGMSPLKSPGPDGMPPLFYQKFWYVIGSDVINCVLHVLNSGTLLHKMNFTHIVLIPKRSDLETVAHFRPISLCNTIVKITSKCIANWLKPILDVVIFPAQSAFIPG